MNRRPLRIAAVAALLATAGSSPRAASADEVTLAQHLEQKAPTIVTVKYVETSADGDDTGQVPGVLVDPSGLVMLSADRVPAKSSSLKVLFGSDPTENDAVLVARDTLTGLAYLEVLEPPGGKPLPFVDFSKGAEPGIGQSLFGITRLSRGFDFAPIVLRLYVTARLETPRVLYDFEGDFRERGLPVYDLQGRPVGVVSEQAAAGTDDETEIFVWPVKDVVRSLEQAKKRAPDALAKAKAKKDEPKKDGEKPNDGEKKDEPKKDEGTKDGEKPKDGGTPSGPK